jgi:hypothetical protein
VPIGASELVWTLWTEKKWYPAVRNMASSMSYVGRSACCLVTVLTALSLAKNKKKEIENILFSFMRSYNKQREKSSLGSFV